MPVVNINIDVDLDDILNDVDVSDIVDYLVENDLMGEVEKRDPEVQDMDDPVVRLAAIVYLRSHGYTVEPS